LTRRLAPARQHVLGPDSALRDAALEVPQRGEDDLAPRGAPHHPALRGALARGEDFELETAARALHRRAAFGDQNIVELVLGSTAVAAYFHRTTESSERDERSGATARTCARCPIFDRECLTAQWRGPHRVPRVPKNQTDRLLACSWVRSRSSDARPPPNGTREPTRSDAACGSEAACYSPAPRSSERWTLAFPIGIVLRARRRHTDAAWSLALFCPAFSRRSSGPLASQAATTTTRSPATGTRSAPRASSATRVSAGGASSGSAPSPRIVRPTRRAPRRASAGSATAPGRISGASRATPAPRRRAPGNASPRRGQGALAGQARAPEARAASVTRGLRAWAAPVVTRGLRAQ